MWGARTAGLHLRIPGPGGLRRDEGGGGRGLPCQRTKIGARDRCAHFCDFFPLLCLSVAMECQGERKMLENPNKSGIRGWVMAHLDWKVQFGRLQASKPHSYVLWEGISFVVKCGLLDGLTEHYWLIKFYTGHAHIPNSPKTTVGKHGKAKRAGQQEAVWGRTNTWSVWTFLFWCKFLGLQNRAVGTVTMPPKTWSNRLQISGHKSRDQISINQHRSEKSLQPGFWSSLP